MCLVSSSAQLKDNHTLLFFLAGRNCFSNWVQNEVQIVVWQCDPKTCLHTSSDKACIRFKNKDNEDMHAAWASPCIALTYAAGERNTSASTSNWKVWHWLGHQCWFARPGLPVLSSLVLHPLFWVACPGSPILGHLSWVTCPGSPVLCHMS